MTVQKEDFAEQLFLLRSQSGLNQEEFAKKINTSKRSISAWETGEGFPRKSLRILLATTFGYPATHFLLDEEMPQSRNQIQQNKPKQDTPEYIIGLDLGNFYSQPGIVLGADPVTKRGGTYHDLTDPSSNVSYGIPTAFFYAKNKFDGEPVCGEQAVKAVPPANCLRYLKRDMMVDGKPNTATIDGRTFSYDEMIVAAVQYALRIAVDQLMKRLHISTNKVALAYPASMSSNAKNRLVQLVEMATLEDGRHFEVVGTIAEPAAAALSYLIQEDSGEDRTVLVYDFGAGTFDVSIVAAYPQGKERSNGDKYYYDVIYTDGLPNLGGAEMDKVVQQMLLELAGEDADDRRTAELIRISAESVKRDLSNAEWVQPQILLSNGFIDSISRSQFETRITPLMEKTMDLVDKAMTKNSDLKIDMIVLTGGSSQMPIVQRMLKERFPAYSDKIRFHQPAKAIGAGAARYGVPEQDYGVTIAGAGVPSVTAVGSTVVVRTIRDIGVEFRNRDSAQGGEIIHYVPSGVPIPYTSDWFAGHLPFENSRTLFQIYEANTSDPDPQQITKDYSLVCRHSHDHGQVRPVNYLTHSRIVIDEKHMAYLEVTEPNNPDMPPQRYLFSIEDNLR